MASVFVLLVKQVQETSFPQRLSAAPPGEPQGVGPKKIVNLFNKPNKRLPQGPFPGETCPETLQRFIQIRCLKSHDWSTIENTHSNHCLC